MYMQTAGKSLPAVFNVLLVFIQYFTRFYTVLLGEQDAPNAALQTLRFSQITHLLDRGTLALDVHNEIRS